MSEDAKFAKGYDAIFGPAPAAKPAAEEAQSEGACQGRDNTGQEGTCENHKNACQGGEKVAG